MTCANIAQADRQQSTMTDRQVVGMLLTVVIGGRHRSRNDHKQAGEPAAPRDQYEQLVEDPSRVARAVEEM